MCCVMEHCLIRRERHRDEAEFGHRQQRNISMVREPFELENGLRGGETRRGARDERAASTDHQLSQRPLYDSLMVLLCRSKESGLIVKL